MKKKPQSLTDAAALRHSAEKRLKGQEQTLQSALSNPQSAADQARLVQELQIHQIELEMQNEELQQARAHAETLLARQEAILAAVPDIIMEVDIHKVYRWANQAGLAFFGDNVIGKQAAFYFVGEQTTFQQVGPLFNGQQEVVCIESWQHRKDGEKRLLAWQCRGLKDESGNITGALSSARDITHQEEERMALRLANERLRRFIDANIIGIVIAKADGAIIEANDYYLRLIGFTRAELEQGKVDWRAITPPEWLPADEQALRELCERGTCMPYEKEYVRRDGIRVPVLLIDTMLPGPGEQIAAFALDISERKRAEETLRQQTEELRARNAELTCFNRSVVGRELRMIELKHEVNELCQRLGESPRYETELPSVSAGPEEVTR